MPFLLINLFIYW